MELTKLEFRKGTARETPRTAEQHFYEQCRCMHVTTHIRVFNGITDGYRPRVRLADDAGVKRGNADGENEGGRTRRGKKTENDSGVL